MQKIKGILLICCLLNSSLLAAQDSTYVLSTSMFNRAGNFRLPPMSQWQFKEGNDSIWANPNFDHSTWPKLDSTLNKGIKVNEAGLYEAWFIIKIKLDSSFMGIPLYLYQNNSAATDIYINGQYFHSFGNTDYKNGNFKGRRYYVDHLPGIVLPIDQEILIAIHFVELHGSLYRLNGLIVGYRSLLSLMNETGNKLVQERNSSTITIELSILSALTILMILFWLIAFLNRSQPHLLYVAFTVSILWGTGILQILNYIVYSSTSNLQFILTLLQGPIVTVFLISFIFLLARILEVVIHRMLKIVFTILVLWTFMLPYFPESDTLNIYSVTLFAFIVFFYLIITRRKKLKGAKVIIVVGLIVTILAFAASFILARILKNDYPEYVGLTVIFIIPFSLLIYIAFWLKEMIGDIKHKAQELVLASNEKQDILRNQNIVLEEQVMERTKELNDSFEHLKSTQSQLIQSEKMASLGELTAGIAHEIQNPLNFVNNFSEVSNELIDEMKTELKNGNQEQATEIANDLKQNLEKINFHGKRADAIVKSMLQHSRTSSGKKELTDINALCDEYLRLSYHGYRAKDKSFNAKFETYLDPTLPKVNVVAQDIGRVILNLINNAFYAVNEKCKIESQKSGLHAGQAGYEPMVTVSTSAQNGKIEIRVSDNGNGIPESIKEKIFQPFFTTKPTGQGTGLGLSLSYDIITKGHGGEIKLMTGENPGTELVILLPAV